MNNKNILNLIHDLIIKLNKVIGIEFDEANTIELENKYYSWQGNKRG